MQEESINYEDVGLRVGLEIHQQLASKRKLFCYCKPELIKDEPDILIVRYMRPTLGETGEIDEAAKKEFKKRKKIIYETYNTLCPYEIDGVPPYPVDEESLKTALLIAKLFKMDVPDVVMVSRKQYLDGSVPSGFQRTILVALNGEMELSDGKKLGITQLCLEEDAARKISESEDAVRFRVDRLGIPLVEITTDSTLNTPEQVLDAALRIGAILRATGKAKRGLGTVRQDINVSIKGGARVEIKGVQRPEWFKRLIDNEIMRQKRLLEITEELRKRNVKSEDILKEKAEDITHIFEKTKAKFIQKAIKRGDKVFAVKLPGFSGLLGREIQKGKRFGKEFAERVSVIVGLKGIIHTDELPAYGISEEEKKNLLKELNANPGRDCVVFVVGPKDKCLDAIREVKERALQALNGVPEETRRAHEDGTTSFERPLGTAARLYPDTDSPPIKITREILAEIERIEIEYPWEKIKRYREQYGLSENRAKELALSEYSLLFEELVRQGVNPKLVATTITETMKALARDGYKVYEVEEEKIKQLLLYVHGGKIAKEAIPDVLMALSESPSKSIDEIIEEIGLKRIGEKELEEIIEQVIRENMNLVEERGERAFSPLMGHIMSKVRGKIDGKKVSQKLREKLKQYIK